MRSPLGIPRGQTPTEVDNVFLLPRSIFFDHLFEVGLTKFCPRDHDASKSHNHTFRLFNSSCDTSCWRILLHSPLVVSLGLTQRPCIAPLWHLSLYFVLELGHHFPWSHPTKWGVIEFKWSFATVNELKNQHINSLRCLGVNHPVFPNSGPNLLYIHIISHYAFGCSHKLHLMPKFWRQFIPRVVHGEDMEILHKSTPLLV
jgi:hypothetical protein